MLRRAVLTATSRLLEYGGLVVNFGCLAAAVFSGAWSGPGQSAGDIASKVSIASFYLLTLIYNFSQVRQVCDFCEVQQAKLLWTVWTSCHHVRV